MMTVCETCGVEGYTKLLFYCSKCQIVAVHRYCMDGPSTIDDGEVSWYCEECVPRVPKPSEPANLNSLDDVENVRPIVRTIGSVHDQKGEYVQSCCTIRKSCSSKKKRSLITEMDHFDDDDDANNVPSTSVDDRNFWGMSVKPGEKKVKFNCDELCVTQGLCPMLDDSDPRNVVSRKLNVSIKKQAQSQHEPQRFSKRVKVRIGSYYCWPLDVEAKDVQHSVRPLDVEVEDVHHSIQPLDYEVEDGHTDDDYEPEILPSLDMAQGGSSAGAGRTSKKSMGKGKMKKDKS